MLSITSFGFLNILLLDCLVPIFQMSDLCNEDLQPFEYI